MTNFPHGLRSRGVPLPSGFMPPTGGNVFHVDSGHANASDSGPGTNPNHPMATLDATIALCTANNGDQIWVYPGHAESVIAAAGLDLDVAGITIVFLGNDNDRGTITFSTDVGADMDVDAADITLINPRFVAGIDALTGPIDVNAARFKMYNAIYEDAAAMGTTDCIVADANADDMVIDGWDYRVSTTGTQKQSNIQIAAADRPTLRNIRITGDFATGPIENGTAWVDALLEDIVIDSANTGPIAGIVLQATSSGQARRVYVRVASGVIAVTADNDMQWFDCWGVGVDAESAFPIGTQAYNVGAFPTGAAAANGVGLAEVLRYAQENIIVGSGTAMPSNSSLYGILAGATGVPTYPAEAAPDDAVSLAEVLRAIYNSVSHSGTASVVTRQTGWGNIVTKTEDVQATADDLFTVTGKVLITLLTGEVTNAIAAGVNDYALRVKTSNEAIAAATSLASDAIGTMYIVSGHPDGILNGRSAPTTRVAALSGVDDGGTNDYVEAHSPMVVGLAGGSLTIESTHTGGDAGDAIVWTLMYIPLEASASVAAAA